MAEEPEVNNNKKRYVQISKPEQSCGHDHSEDKDHCYYKGGPMSHELFSHLPFSVLSVTAGLIFAGLICFMVPDALVEKAGTVMHSHDHGDHDCEDHSSHESHDHESHEGHDHSSHEGHNHGDHDCEDHDSGNSALGFLFLFHLFHPAHILFSAIATTAMFYKYDKSLIKAVLIGFVGSIVICTVSDALIPTATIHLMGYGDVPMHVCIEESPMKVIPFAFLGVLLGLAATISGNTNSTIMSHSIHVVTSTMATLFYTIAFVGRLDWINHIGTVFLMTCIAVGGICCLSDVILPMFFTKKAREEYARTGHHHPH